VKLPHRVSDNRTVTLRKNSASLLVMPSVGEQRSDLTVTEARDGWLFSLTMNTRRVSPEPVALNVTPADPESGLILTAEVLRHIPLRALRAQAESKLAEEAAEQAIPNRITSRQDYARLASFYIQMLNEGHRHPVARASRYLDVSPNTMNARIQRLWTLGLLDESATGEPKLSRKARRWLQEGQKDG
jgi:hypothetical protein